MPKYSSSYDNVKKYGNECVYPPITTWLRSFMDAEMVITDSFHGTVFSIIFNKPFFVLINKERGATRFISLLSLFDLEDRVIDSVSDASTYEKEIDWYSVNSRINDLQNYSINFLRRSLNS